MGEIGLVPGIARALTWPEVDSYQHGYDTRHQKALAGHRLVATMVYNALADKPLKEHEFLPLPAVDGARAAARPGPNRPDAAFLERMARRFGEPITLLD